MAEVPFDLTPFGAFLSVVIIDIVLAGDNAIVVGLVASGLAAEKRSRLIALGILAAAALRILFAYFVAALLEIIGLTLAGGILLLWVSWKIYRELRQRNAACAIAAGAHHGSAAVVFSRIVLADLSMSLDNVLAVAGAAREHIWVLIFGLALSVALTGFAAARIARLLDRHFWISWIGLGIIGFVALHMIWSGSAEIYRSVASSLLF